MIQEYDIEVERLWADYDHFLPVTMWNDPHCKSREVSTQRRTMHFLKHVNLSFDQRRAILLAKPANPTLATMIQEETRMKLLSDATGVPGVQSALMVSNSSRSKNWKCYNCGEVGHLKNTCPKPSKEIEYGGRGRGD